MVKDSVNKWRAHIRLTLDADDESRANLDKSGPELESAQADAFAL